MAVSIDEQGTAMTANFYTESDNHIQIFRFRESTDTAIQAWADALDEYIGSIPEKTPFYVLLDVTGENVEFTALARQESKRIFTKYQTHVGYLAMLFEWRTSPYFARLFFASIGKLGFKLKYFTKADEARQWLDDMHTS